MGQVTLSIDNIHKPAPRWFRKLKNALSYLVDGALIILLSLGYTDNTFLMLILRIGYARVISAIEALLANGEDYTTTNSKE